MRRQHGLSSLNVRWRWLRVRADVGSTTWYIIDVGRTTSLREVRTRAKKEEELKYVNRVFILAQEALRN